MKLKLLIFLFVTLPLAAQVALPTDMTFTYQVPLSTTDLASNDPMSSAAVFDSTGANIRTLWTARQEISSNTLKSATWNGLDNQGNQAAAGTYTIKVLMNKVKYIWDGVIGSTSDSWTENNNNWSQFGTPPTLKFVIVGGVGWGVSGYAEGQYGMFWFNRNKPNSPTILSTNYLNNIIAMPDLATDDKELFLMNGSTGGTWITKFSAYGGMPSAFTNGTSIVGSVGSQTPNTGYNNTTLSVIDQSAAGVAIPTGIAVQTGGQIVAVAHGNNVLNVPNTQTPNSIHLFDKTTGSSLGNITITNPQQMAFASAGLWVVANGALNLITGVGTSNTITSPIAGLSNPVAVAVNRVNNHVYVLDGGTSQQLKEYDASNALVRTYGDAGGYTDGNPTITNTRLMLDNQAILTNNTTNGSWVSVEDNGDVWFSDAGTGQRVLHVTPNGASYTYVNRILYTPALYDCAVDHNNPSRVFAGYLEYTRDYTKPIVPGDPDPALGGNGAWTGPVKNWNVGNVPPSGKNLKGYILTVETLSNGRTYGQINGFSTNFGYMAEFPNDGTPLRYTGQTSVFQAPVLMRDGSLMFVTSTGTTPNLNQTVTRQALTGFDGSNNPTWASSVNVTVVNANANTQPTSLKGGGVVPNVWPTTGGVYPVWYAQAYTTLGHPHLGGAIAGRNSYVFTVNPDACMLYPDLKGNFPSGDGSPARPCPGTNGFGGHSGTIARSEGRFIYVVYDGQYATWGNSFSQFYEDGLFVGEFTQQTVSRNRFISLPAPTYPVGFAANFSTAMVASVGLDHYLFLATESGFTPLDEWRITNMASIHEYGGSGTLGSNVALTNLF
jgi:hypothetical protein